jgi:hypothetical protein
VTSQKNTGDEWWLFLCGINPFYFIIISVSETSQDIVKQEGGFGSSCVIVKSLPRRATISPSDPPPAIIASLLGVVHYQINEVHCGYRRSCEWVG